MTNRPRTMERHIALTIDLPAEVSSVARTIRERGDEVFAGACSELTEPVAVSVTPILETTDVPTARWTMSLTPACINSTKLPSFTGELWARPHAEGTQLELHGSYHLSSHTYAQPLSRLRGHLLACDAFALFLSEVAQRIDIDARWSPEELDARVPYTWEPVPAS